MKEINTSSNPEDTYRGWVSYLCSVPEDPVVQEELEGIRAQSPWTPLSAEDTLWAVGKAARKLASTGEVAPPPLEQIHEADMGIEQVPLTQQEVRR